MSNIPNGSQPAAATIDRRLHTRRPIRSMLYVKLGKDNGGIILNISEGGLAVASAGPLDPSGPAQLQFQIPGLQDSLTTSFETAWISESKTEAGIRFVEISDNSRERIKAFIVSGTQDAIGTRQRAWRPLDVPPGLVPHSAPRQPKGSSETAAKSLTLAAKTPQGSTDAAGSVTASAVAPSRRVSRPHRRWGIFLVLVIAAGAIAFRFAPRPGPLPDIVSRTESPASSPLSVSGPSVESAPPQTNETEPPSLDAPSVDDSSPSRSRDMSQSAADFEAPRESAEGSVASSSREMARGQEAVPETRSQASSSAGPQVENGSPQAESSGASVAVPPTPAEKETAKGSISASFAPYPSLRLPPGLKSPTSADHAALQIGQLLLRVDPAYPEDAEKQQIEGTVRLHLVIGPDGAIESVEPRSGPTLLVPAAVNAVRQWRYTPSFLGAQPVEAEQDVAIRFQLAK